MWRRKYRDEKAFPRRLIYCLPVRVLVEQTYNVMRNFVEKTDFPDIGVYKLLGGEVEEEWHYSPEKEAVIIGTQDMLLSRALNRGFAQSRFAWPLDFALLNNDCFWVLDEIQLMGSGLATSTQLQAFREHFGTWGKCKSVWLSATLNTDWLKTVDFRDRVDILAKAELLEDDLRYENLSKRMQSKKTLKCYEREYKPRELAQFVKSRHRPGTKTLAIFNTVERATDFYIHLKKSYKKSEMQPDMVLIHSRFRGAEREEKTRIINDEAVPPEGRIIVSTQVVEAGVDISSATLFTELAPWPSIVQRLGRCNRYGEYEEAVVYWVNLDEKDYPPYEKDEMEQARHLLRQLEGESLSPSYLQTVQYLSDPRYRFVIRNKDIRELFDNTPDLTGHDIDVSRFIRDTEALDLQVFWRNFQNGAPQNISAPSNGELCPVPYYDFREWLKKIKEKDEKVQAYVWDYLEGRWIAASNEMLWPGSVVLLPCEAGGYDIELGWYSRARDTVMDISDEETARQPLESTSSDPYEVSTWVSLSEHSENVKEELTRMLTALADIFEESAGTCKRDLEIVDALSLAAFLHDVGKASDIFQGSFTDVPGNDFSKIWAKGRMKGGRIPYARKYFRHELVSALLVLQNREILGEKISSEQALSLVSYIIASHHGKVRCAIRALPGEDSPDDGRRFALGVWEGDVIDEFRIGEYHFPRTILDMSCMELGYGKNEEPSWVERCVGLLDEYGPFRLSYLEALVRCADARASEAERLASSEKS